MDKKEIKELIDRVRKENLLLLKQREEYRELLTETLIKLEYEDSDDLKDVVIDSDKNIGLIEHHLRETEHCIDILEEYVEEGTFTEEEIGNPIMIDTLNRLIEEKGIDRTELWVQYYYDKLKRFDL